MIEKPTRQYELAVLLAMGAALLFAFVGTVFVNLVGDLWFRIGKTLLALGLVATLTSVGLASQVDRGHFFRIVRGRGDRYDQLRNWTRLKVASIFLQILMALAGVILLLAVLVRVGLYDAQAPFRGVVLATSILTLCIIGAVIASQFFSLRTRLNKSNPGIDDAFLLLTLVGGGLLAMLTVLVTFLDLHIPGLAVLKHTDTPFLLLAASVLGGIGLFIGRSLPSIYALFYEERDYYRGKNYLSQTKSVVMPAAAAFSLLFLVVLITFVFELGLVGLTGSVQRSALLLGLFAVIVLALVASAIVSVVLSRAEDKTELYKVKRGREERQSILVTAISGSITAVLLAIATILYAGIEFAGLRSGWWLDFFTFGVLTAVGPYGFYVASRAARIRHLEERFPDFLRDIAASHKAGLPLASAVRIAANGEYGALTPEIRKMADQLSWNVVFSEVLERFAERVDTPLVRRSVSLMIEASNSGGNIVDVLMAAARDSREIKNLETERRSSMMLYTAVIYLTFVVFLGVAIMLYKTFISEILAVAEQALASGGGAQAGFSFSSLTLDDYRVFYFVAALMQGLGNGVIAGLMGTGRLLMGLRHSFLMVAMTYLVFKMFA